mgnify:FL=1
MPSLSSTARITRLALVLCLFGYLAGCASPSKVVIDVRLQPVATPSNPDIRVAIGEVVDLREFSSTVESRSLHQMVTEGYADPQVTGRALGLFWTAGGTPIWDFMLPEGRSVTMLVEEALKNAFREVGMEVVEPTEAGAIPIRAEIIRFWTWNTGSWTFQFHFETDVRIQGQLPPFESGEVISGRMRLKSAMAGGPRAYTNTVTKGLGDFIEQFKSRVR